MLRKRFSLQSWKKRTHTMARKSDEPATRKKAKKPNFDAHAGGIVRCQCAAKRQATTYLQVRLRALQAKYPKLISLYHSNGEPWRLQVRGDMRPYEHNVILADKRYLEMCQVAAEAYCRFGTILGEISCLEPPSK